MGRRGCRGGRLEAVARVVLVVGVVLACVTTVLGAACPQSNREIVTHVARVPAGATSGAAFEAAVDAAANALCVDAQHPHGSPACESLRAMVAKRVSAAAAGNSAAAGEAEDGTVPVTVSASVEYARPVTVRLGVDDTGATQSITVRVGPANDTDTIRAFCDAHAVLAALGGAGSPACRVVQEAVAPTLLDTHVWRVARCHERHKRLRHELSLGRVTAGSSAVGVDGSSHAGSTVGAEALSLYAHEEGRGTTGMYSVEMIAECVPTRTPSPAEQRHWASVGDTGALPPVTTAASWTNSGHGRTCFQITAAAGEPAASAAARTCKSLLGNETSLGCSDQVATIVRDRRASGKEWWQSSDDVLQSLPSAYSRAVARMEAAIQASGMMIENFHRVMAAHPSPRRVCEIGVNAGHSAAVWMTARPDAATEFYGFDLGEHVYTRPSLEALAAMFPGRVHMTYGDSTRTVPRFAMDNPDVKCDLLFVDGGHTVDVALADLYHFQLMANPTYSLVLLDDAAEGSEVDTAWHALVSSGDVVETARLVANDGVRFSAERVVAVGEYVVRKRD